RRERVKVGESLGSNVVPNEFSLAVWRAVRARSWRGATTLGARMGAPRAPARRSIRGEASNMRNIDTLSSYKSIDAVFVRAFLFRGCSGTAPVSSDEAETIGEAQGALGAEDGLAVQYANFKTEFEALGENLQHHFAFGANGFLTDLAITIDQTANVPVNGILT